MTQCSEADVFACQFYLLLLQSENRRCQEGVKASYSYGKISFSITGCHGAENQVTCVVAVVI